ncbi:unnamed protein product [Rangifer tarandus platyrhynchus]|uniref:Uncharacterized protein n=3 Tax=Rangifer tarandus platyrhynchus TaxID=3082113 RepID=A0ABN8YZE2_RANTA|nr:unnamed protein product [Rangifer tarandus platyrhynchus]CAI9705287.1 unnamed protein product [Rangifer tarandus platyrhynchus]
MKLRRGRWKPEDPMWTLWACRPESASPLHRFPVGRWTSHPFEAKQVRQGVKSRTILTPQTMECPVPVQGSNSLAGNHS